MPDYDWSKNGDDLVFGSSAAVAVYVNADGDLVIRQQRDRYEDEDSVVIVPSERVPALIRRISQVAALQRTPPRLVKD